MSLSILRHEFVGTIPDALESGVLYLSIEFRTSIHLCCCGCQNVVVLPIRPTAWRLTYDGENVSMAPSIGNWSFPCRSHYWIRGGRVVWAEQWSDEKVEAGRRQALNDRGAPSFPLKPNSSVPPERSGGVGFFRRWGRGHKGG